MPVVYFIQTLYNAVGIGSNVTDSGKLSIALANVNQHSTKSHFENRTLEEEMKEIDKNIKLKLIKIYENDYKAFSYPIPNY